MDTTRLSTKGQVILPKSVRTALNIAPGTRFNVKPVGGAVLLQPLQAVKPTRMSDVLGSAGYHGKRLSLTKQDRALKLRSQRSA